MLTVNGSLPTGYGRDAVAGLSRPSLKRHESPLGGVAGYAVFEHPGVVLDARLFFNGADAPTASL